MSDGHDNDRANVAAFTAVEELDEAAQALGWNIEYRQMRRGKFSAWFASQEADGIALASERFDNRLHVISEPPDGDRWDGGELHRIGVQRRPSDRRVAAFRVV